jgi:hypothetical protein
MSIVRLLNDVARLDFRNKGDVMFFKGLNDLGKIGQRA